MKNENSIATGSRLDALVHEQRTVLYELPLVEAGLP
jgi:hypothetical protein